jgi:hypothetical protein
VKGAGKEVIPSRSAYTFLLCPRCCGGGVMRGGQDMDK